VVVNPREVTVSGILQHVRKGRVRGVHTLHDGAAEVIEVDALETTPVVGRPLREIDLPEGVIIGALVRDGRVLMPRGDTVIRPNDRVTILCLADKVHQAEQMFTVRPEFF
jgi:trk system potassium uptake protein TrkA